MFGAWRSPVSVPFDLADELSEEVQQRRQRCWLREVARNGAGEFVAGLSCDVRVVGWCQAHESGPSRQLPDRLAGAGLRGTSMIMAPPGNHGVSCAAAAAYLLEPTPKESIDT